jgi:hypothetical protein
MFPGILLQGGATVHWLSWLVHEFVAWVYGIYIKLVNGVCTRTSTCGAPHRE